MLNNKTQSDSSDTKVAEDSAPVGGKQSFNRQQRAGGGKVERPNVTHFRDDIEKI